MCLFLTAESLKFYRFKNKKFERLSFLLLLIINILFQFLMKEDINSSLSFDDLFSKIAEIPQTANVLILFMPYLTFLIRFVLHSFVSYFFMYFYACIYSANRSGYSYKIGISNFLKGLPKLILFYFFMSLILILSSIVLGIPYFILSFVFFLAPMFYCEEKLSFFKGLNKSHQYTDGGKMRILLSSILIGLIIGAVRSIFQIFTNTNDIYFLYIEPFIATIYAVVYGRFRGLCYFVFYKENLIERSYQSVLSSAELKDIIMEHKPLKNEDRH